MAGAKRTVVAVTGSAGAMGSEIVAHLLDSDKDFELRLFINNRMGHLRSFFRRLLKRGKKRMSIIRGNLGNYNEVEKLVFGADYVIHCGALIPPKADHDPENTIKTNFGGTKNIVDAIMNSGRADKIKMVHISTVAVYGNRDHKHPWARMGDPVMSSPYDYYSASKIKAERYVLESELLDWVILRQTAVYHKYFLVNNLSDGLMFHTCWNAPLKWITGRDSGLCIKNLVEKDIDGKLGGFWKKKLQYRRRKILQGNRIRNVQLRFCAYGSGNRTHFQSRMEYSQKFSWGLVYRQRYSERLAWLQNRKRS